MRGRRRPREQLLAQNGVEELHEDDDAEPAPSAAKEALPYGRVDERCEVAVLRHAEGRKDCFDGEQQDERDQDQPELAANTAGVRAPW